MEMIGEDRIMTNKVDMMNVDLTQRLTWLEDIVLYNKHEQQISGKKEVVKESRQEKMHKSSINEEIQENENEGEEMEEM